MTTALNSQALFKPHEEGRQTWKIQFKQNREAVAEALAISIAARLPQFLKWRGERPHLEPLGPKGITFNVSLDPVWNKSEFFRTWCKIEKGVQNLPPFKEWFDQLLVEDRDSKSNQAQFLSVECDQDYFTRKMVKLTTMVYKKLGGKLAEMEEQEGCDLVFVKRIFDYQTETSSLSSKAHFFNSPSIEIKIFRKEDLLNKKTPIQTFARFGIGSLGLVALAITGIWLLFGSSHPMIHA